jgi:hypothetical protein
MCELPSAFVEPIEATVPAPEPDITAYILKNAIKVTAFTEGSVATRARKVVGDKPRPSIEFI